MNFLQRTTTVLFALLFPLVLFSQHKKAGPGKKSPWILPVTFDPTAQPEVNESTSSYYLLIDEQENTITREDYNHFAYRILTNEGLQEMSDLTFEFDPTYQEIIFHEVRIIRDGQTIDHLSRNIRTVQREQSMDRYLYDGSLTAIINLQDVRKGDIIEYSYTLKGYNPVYAGHISRNIYFDYGIGYEKFHRRLILPSGKPHEIKFFNDKHVDYRKETSSTQTTYTWTLERRKGIVADDDVPYWYENNRFASISDFRSWKEVAKWANELFLVTAPEQARITSEFEQISKESDLNQYALDAIGFVQDEVRYLGFESGLNSHKPHPPLKVYDQRFGDCKDKSLLLVTLLRARNIEAWPVLVNTFLGDKIAERLPSANIFDHCVVKFVIDGRSIFIDPTISSQGGTIGNIPFPHYRIGLVVSPSTQTLEVLPEPVASTTSEVQTVEMASIGGEATLTVRTVYTGSSADYQRGEFARNSLQSVQKNYKEYYANLYSDLEVWEEIKVDDNRKDNVLVVLEKYKIPMFWRPVEGQEGLIRAEFYPQTMANYFDVTVVGGRASPYRLPFPVDYHHHIQVKLSEEWPVEKDNVVISSPYYEYEHDISYSFGEINKRTYYRTTSDHVPPAYLGKFAADHKKMQDNLSYQLTYNQNVARASASNLPGIIVTILAIIGSVYCVFAIYNRYDPKPERNYLRGTPIGGWLILVGIGVTLSPLRILFDFFQDPSIANGSTWMTWLALKRYGIFTFSFLIHVYNLFSVLFSALLAILFYQRRSSFPRLMTIQLAMTAMMTIVDTVLARQVSDDPQAISSTDMVRSIGAAAIWIPYLNISTRAKETFVKRHRSDTRNGSSSEREEEIVNTHEEGL